ncbi:H-2 class II histocompatibility antigen, A-U alpha chain-like isoform X2 [Sardina pilchardus]|uniref:H-2 class II histocompatibility antigen, A-U alpha chain-like isoform X2 n=1 Tax=Sardina pilchardus TaxID=27697 RepID=UPI002E0D9B99
MKMTLTGIFLVLAGIIYTEAKYSDEESIFDMNGEEIGHADFKARNFVMTLPEFAELFTYGKDMYEVAVNSWQTCKYNLALSIKNNKNPAVAKAAPMTSLFPRDEVKAGTENTLTCYITGVYPPLLNVTWTRNNKVISQGVKNSQLHANLRDGSFTMFSTLRFTPEKGDVYSCTVEHSALEQPLTREFDVEVPDPSLGPLVFCVVGLTLGSLGVAAGTFILVRRENRTSRALRLYGHYGVALTSMI